MEYNIFFKMLLLSLAINVESKCLQLSNALTDFVLSDSRIRYGHLRCLQQYPQADVVNYSDTPETHCFLHCFIYKLGLMNLTSRGLDSTKFIDIWIRTEVVFEEYTCLEGFDFSEPLSGKCIDSYRKLMEFRTNCLNLFEYIFARKNSLKSKGPEHGKFVGQSATEFCNFMDGHHVLAGETFRKKDVSLPSQYKDKLKCVFENIYYLDAYGRVDESEILLSYQEAQADTPDSRNIIQTCCHRANMKFQREYYGNMVLELQNCLISESPIYSKVYKLRDEASRRY